MNNKDNSEFSIKDLIKPRGFEKNADDFLLKQFPDEIVKEYKDRLSIYVENTTRSSIDRDPKDVEMVSDLLRSAGLGGKNKRTMIDDLSDRESSTQNNVSILIMSSNGDKELVDECFEKTVKLLEKYEGTTEIQDKDVSDQRDDSASNYSVGFNILFK